MNRFFSDLHNCVMIASKDVKTIYDLVTKAGEVHGTRTYLRYEENEVVKDITYKQFAESCEAIRGWAQEKNNEYENKVRVGIIGGSSFSYMSVLIGVMSNGNVVVPLDIQLNLDTLADCVNRADLDYLFYDWEYLELVEGVKELCVNLKETICLQNRKHVSCVQQIWKQYEGSKGQPNVNPKDCAMLLFTSGTTGKAKGVLLSHENLIDNVFCTDDTGTPGNEVYMNVLPIHHIFCINGDILIGLRYGNVVCLNQDMAKLGSHIQLFQPSIIRMVPMMAKTLYNRIAVLKETHKDKSIEEIKACVLGKRLHKIVSGGGYLAPDLAKCYNDIGISIAQGYGMSECSPKIAAPDWSRPDKVESVGKVVKGCQVRIVDGEIQVKSPSVMMGYYKDEEETKKTIIEDGWLRTGDLGYIDEEGFLYFTGRCKNLIILSNGENVAPEQLENLFVDETLIEDILVYGEDDKICAEVYPNFQLAEAMGIEDLEQEISQIIQRYNQDLPSYKRILESHIREIPFEKTSSRKIIRGKYFEQRDKEKQESLNLVMPKNDKQQIIYNSVAQCLGHHRFGIDTDLYQAGLDSLGSVLLLADLYEKLQISITLEELGENATVEKIEAFAQNQQQNKKEYPILETYPLTGLQTYFGYILRGNTTSNLPFLYKLDKSVDLERLKWATEQLFEVHVELKDIIQPQNGVLTNFRDDNRKIEIPITTLTDEEWEKERKGLIKLFMYTENEPLYHAGIYKTDSGNYFFFDLAHIIGDGMSMNIIFEDINAIYKGEKLSKQQYSYYEYILDEMERQEQGQVEKDIKYFMELTHDLKIKKSILNRKDYHDLEQGTCARIKKALENISRKRILAYCHKHGVSENVMFLTAFNYCVSVFANEDDVLVTSVHSGRTDSRWNRLIGALFLTYYFRYTRKAHETVPELLKKSGKQILKTMDCHISNLHMDEMFFQFQGDILNIEEIGGAKAERQSVQLDALPFHMQVMQDKDGYYYELRYWENRYDKQQLETFLGCYEAILQAMLVESSVRRLKKYIPEGLQPKHFTVTAEALKAQIGDVLKETPSPDTPIKVYVLDDSCLKKPFGAWGDLYIMDYQLRNPCDQMENPYGDGTLYYTGLTARITPAGNVELLEDCGRAVMVETVRGREYPELHQIEQALCECEGVKKAEAYIYYGQDRAIQIGATVYGEDLKDQEVIKEALATKIKEEWIPKQILCEEL